MPAPSGCQPKVPNVNYWDEKWWKNFFENDLNVFYSSLKGLVAARDMLLKFLSGDLAQILADSNKRDIALKVLLGGIKKDCIDKGLITNDCIPSDSAAAFYKHVLGIGLTKNLDEELKQEGPLTRLVQILRYKSLDNIGSSDLGLIIRAYESNSVFTDDILDMKTTLDNIYSSLGQFIGSPQPINYDYFDLINAFMDFLNKGVRLLPLYNPFTFFIQSLHAPKPYIELMYCKDLFNDQVKELMTKYRVELTKAVDPNLNIPELDEELAVIKHKEFTLGYMLIILRFDIYWLTYRLSNLGYPVKDELKAYVSEYKYLLDKIISSSQDALPNAKVNLACFAERKFEIKNGIVNIGDIVRSAFFLSFNGENCQEPRFYFNTLDYKRFIEVYSPLFFLGIAWISKEDRRLALNMLH